MLDEANAGRQAGRQFVDLKAILTFEAISQKWKRLIIKQ
jgi:hypothetical protein